MVRRKRIPSDVVADVLVASRRRCCVCYGLSNNTSETRGQVAHLDRDPSNSERENLVFLCFKHHDEYDSRPSQSKGLTRQEVERYRVQLDRFISKALPPSDRDIAVCLLATLDRPAFRTPFRQESSLPRFRAAIIETISTINTGRTPDGGSLSSKVEVRDPSIKEALDTVIQCLVALRASYDDLLRGGEIEPCGCKVPDCPIHMLSKRAIQEMDDRRRKLLAAAHSIDPAFPADFYDLR